MTNKTRLRSVKSTQTINLTEELLVLMNRHEKLKVRNSKDTPDVARRFRFTVGTKCVEIQMVVSDEYPRSL